MANLVRERYNGNFGYYNVNTHINPTNVCVYKCDFCAFRADLNEAKAYVMDRDRSPRAGQAGQRAGGDRAAHRRRPASQAAVHVLCRRGALDQGTAPEIHVKAYTAVEIEFFAKIARRSTESPGS